METIKYYKKQDDLIHLRLPWIIAGAVFALISIIPFIVLGENSVITYHDQLDGELITYLLNAKHLFDGSNVYPEVMNGIAKNGMIPPAPLFVLFFKVFKPYHAFIAGMITIRIVSVIYMFLLIDELTDKKILAFIMAIFFMLLPFYVVYGLCIPGQPIVYYAILKFKREKLEWAHYIEVALYVLCSSFSLVGFAILSLCGVVFLIMLIRREHPLRYLNLCLFILTGYCIENITLVKQALGLSKGFVSHKSEINHSARLFFDSIKNTYLVGADYTKAYQKYYLILILLAIVIGGLFLYLSAGEKKAIEKAYIKLIYSSVSIVVVSLIISFFEGSIFTSFSNSKTGLIHDFNFTRFTWLMTVLWVVALALSINLLWLIVEVSYFKVLWAILFFAITLTMVGLSFFHAFMDSDLKSNVVKIARHGDYYMLTWQQFFAEDLFSEIEKLTGENKSDYRVVSLGIYPAAASYNGFYCLDAYSNNYDVEYKHDFRGIIAPQLEKSQYLADWYDGWGNRCYIVLNESMNYFTFEKKWTPYSVDYELNFEKLRELGCVYIISATYLVDAESYGLRLINEKPIDSDDSWYQLWIYSL